MNNLIYSAGSVVIMILQLVFYIVIASALISWVNPDPNNPIVRFINGVSEPLYKPFRRFTSKLGGPLDWAPLIVLLLLMFLLTFLRRFVAEYR